jgi:hypothetical protein
MFIALPMTGTEIIARQTLGLRRALFINAAKRTAFTGGPGVSIVAEYGWTVAAVRILKQALIANR